MIRIWSGSHDKTPRSNGGHLAVQPLFDTATVADLFLGVCFNCSVNCGRLASAPGYLSHSRTGWRGAQEPEELAGSDRTSTGPGEETRRTTAVVLQ
jgi:hypothetical protein